MMFFLYLYCSLILYCYVNPCKHCALNYLECSSILNGCIAQPSRAFVGLAKLIIYTHNASIVTVIINIYIHNVHIGLIRCKRTRFRWPCMIIYIYIYILTAVTGHSAQIVIPVRSLHFLSLYFAS